MVDDTRFHDGSSYEKGFEAGWLFRPQHTKPVCPYKTYSRAANRWRRGYRAGIEAYRTKEEIRGGRSREASERDLRRFMKAAENRQEKADERFSSDHNP